MCHRELWGSACVPLPRWRPTILMVTQDCCRRFWALRHSAWRIILQSRRICLITVQLTVGRAHSDRLSETCHTLAFGSGGARSCRKFHHRVSRVSGMDAPSAVLLNDHRIKFSNLESMGCHCTTPGFWSGSAFRSRLVCWIRVLVRGCTRCPVSRPLTRPANFTEMCAL